MTNSIFGLNKQRKNSNSKKKINDASTILYANYENIWNEKKNKYYIMGHMEYYNLEIGGVRETIIWFSL